MEGQDPTQPGWEQPLTSRLLRVGRPGLEAYLEQGGLVGAQRAARFSRVEALTELRASGLRERGLDAAPLYLTWQRFLEQPGPGLLVAEARPADPRSLAERALLAGNPFLLVEGLIIAALVSGAEQARVLLSPEQADLAPLIQGAWEEIARRDPLEGEGPRLSLSFPGRGEEVPAGARVLLHCLETWCQLPLLTSWGAGWFRGLGRAGQGGTRLLTVGGHVGSPGLLEAPMGASLWQILEAAGGIPGRDMASFQGLALDGGLGGFLALESAATPLAPEELAGLGCAPVPSTVWALGPGDCLVEETGRALERLAAPEGEDGGLVRELILKALDLARRAGRAGLSGREDSLAASERLLDELQTLAWELKALGSRAARPLITSLNQFGEQWAGRLAGRGCSAQPSPPPRPAP